MNNFKKFGLIIVILLVVKIALVMSVQSPSSFSDEYVFAKMARSVYYEQSFTVDGIPTNVHPPLYPIILSLAYASSKTSIVYGIMKIINVALSMLIILPAYLLLKEFFNKKKSLTIATLITVLPPFFTFPAYIMAENLFYVLFLFFIYSLYKSLNTSEIKWDILAGIFMVLSFLTKFSGIVLIAIPASFIIIKLIKKNIDNVSLKQFILKRVYLYIISLAIALPWIIRTGNTFGYSLGKLLGGYQYEAVAALTHNNYAISFINWFIIYIGYLLIASGVIFGILVLTGFKERERKKQYIYILLGLSALFFLIVASNHASGIVRLDSPFSWLTERPIGRYIETLIPLIIIAGFISLENLNKKYLQRAALISIPIFFIASQLTVARLFLVNNLSMSFIEITKYILNFIIFRNTEFEFPFKWITFGVLALIFIALPVIIWLAATKNKINYSNSIKWLGIFILALTVINAITVPLSANNFWNENEQMQLGKFLDKYDPEISTVIIDEDYEGKTNWRNEDDLYERFTHDNTFTVMSGFWLNDNLKIGSVEEKADFIITKKDLPLTKLKETSHGVKLYEVS